MTSVVGAVAASLAERLPARDVETLANAVLGGAVGVARARQAAANAAMRAAADDVSRLLRGGHSADLVAGSLFAAAHCMTRQRAGQKVDVVWTGPESAVGTSRLTVAAVADLLDSARAEILLVSYATQPEPTIVTALEAAVARGVTTTLLLERAADNPAYRGATNPFANLTARRLAWLSDRRSGGASMHAKVIVIDDHAALVGSANVTGHAMTKNIECGILIRGGPTPARIKAHVLSLLERGDLSVV